MDLSLMLIVSLAVSSAGSAVYDAIDDTRFKEADDLHPAPENLKHVFIIFRHGIRTPLFDLTKYKLTDFQNTWKEGRGVLTESGKQLMLHVGESLRTRYRHVVPAFTPEAVEVTSTKVERAILSAKYVCQGMFSDLDPAKIVVTQKTFDKEMIFEGTLANSICPEYTKLRDIALSEEKASESWLRRLFYKVLTKELERNGSPMKVDSLLNAAQVWDTFIMEKYNLKFDRPWAEPFMDYLSKLVQHAMWRYINGKTRMIQFFTGPMISQILQEMDKSKSEEHVSLHLHGSHDKTLCPVYWVLSHEETYYAKPGDTILVELYKDDTVKVLLYSPLEDRPSRRLRNVSLKRLCKNNPCTLDQFRKDLSTVSLTEEEWNNSCHEDLDSYYRKEPWTGLFVKAKPLHLWAKKLIRQKILRKE